ncbi:hypothetical protein ZIOFF_061938 [Zingiber officinale]|uniref:Afadin/alpha-actinin-binding protein n=1 Tax=Zingiber officinale TaxID=94328 RepID=A0A8J5K8X6_ZINOF|nr:hypothetical protein ZIOFF_061938 [Zingiber officinale]
MAGTLSDFDLGASSAPPFGIREHAFADDGNLEHCVKYLNQTLVTFGFSASLDLFATDPVSVARTCNCIHSLLQQRQRDIEFREGSNEQKQRLQSDISRLEAKVERLESQLAAKDRELATLTRMEAKNKASLKIQMEKLQQERDEFQKMVIGNQNICVSLLFFFTTMAPFHFKQVRTQQMHEMKKKEKEYMKLQTDLFPIGETKSSVSREKKGVSVRDGDNESIAGQDLDNKCFLCVHFKEGRQRGTWNGKKADSDFYKMIVDAYEVKKQELMTENSDLRALLRSMQMDMRDFLNAPNGLPQQTYAVNEKQDVESPQSPLGGRTVLGKGLLLSDNFPYGFFWQDVFDLPFHMARDQIEESLRTKMSSIKERMTQLQDAQKGAEVTCEATERELELEAQLVEARSIIQEQVMLFFQESYCFLVFHCIDEYASIMSKRFAKTDKPRRLSSHFDAEREIIHPTSAECRNSDYYGYAAGVDELCTLDQQVWFNPPLYSVYRTLATLDRLTCTMSCGALTKLEITKPVAAVSFSDLLKIFHLFALWF